MNLYLSSRLHWNLSKNIFSDPNKKDDESRTQNKASSGFNFYCTVIELHWSKTLLHNCILNILCSDWLIKFGMDRKITWRGTHHGWLRHRFKFKSLYSPEKDWKGSWFLPGSESELPVGDWHKLEGIKILFLGTVAGNKESTKEREDQMGVSHLQ